ncbi:MAG: hypothetical protein ACK5RA_00420, partial [Cyanobacteriota bacterium]
MVAFLFSQSFASPPKIHPPKEGYLPHPGEMRQKEVGLQYLRTILVTLIHPPARNSSRVGQHLQLALGAAVALAASSLSPGSARAFNVIVGGTQYDVTTFTGTFIANSSKFALPPAPGVMPWFENPTLIDSFATAVGTNLGMNNTIGSNTEGPLFAVNQTGTAKAWCTQGCSPNPSVDTPFYNPNTSY